MLRAALIGLMVHVSGMCCAQEFPPIHFIQLTDKDGLSNNKTTSVAQDTNGVIWIGTVNGLNRFDGYHFAKFYSNQHDPRSLPGSKIIKIFPDSAGHFWLMTAEGMCCFNTTTLASQTFRSDTPSSFHTYIGDNIYFEDKNHPYIITPYGLLYFSDSVHCRFMTENFPSYVFQKNLYHGYTDLARDDGGQTWAFLGNRIFKVDRITKQVLETHVAPWDINIDNLFFDHRHRAWLSTWNAGIYIYDPDRDTWAKIPLDQLHVSGYVVQRCVEWAWNSGKYLVFPTNAPGLVLVNEATDHCYFYHLPPGSGFIGRIFTDRQNILWVPTDDGVYYAPPSNNLFDLVRVSPEDHGGLKSGEPDQSCVYDIKELPSGYWISKRYDGGIYWFTKDWRLKGFWPKTVEGPDSLFPNAVGTHREGYDFEQVGNHIYITTEWGMMVMDLRSFRKKLYTIPGIVANTRLRTIVPENEHTWWIRSLAKGIFQFDPTTCRFKRRYLLEPACPDCVPPVANYMILDKQGRVFVTTNAGLYKYDRAQDTFFKVKPTGNLLPGNLSQGLAEDSSGRLWIGSDNGICVFNPDTKEVERTFPENRKIGQIVRIVTDPYQNIWFNSVSGYWCWLRKQDKMVQFGYDMDLPDNDEGAFYAASDGLVYGGGTDAVIRFYPERLMAYSNHAATRIVEIRVNDSLVLPMARRTGEKLLDLKPWENNLGLYFDVLNYDLRDNNLYFYRLEPGNETWKQNEDGHLSFNNLEPGTYRLSVAGSNKLTGKFTPTDTLLFTVQPYWYQTWWWKIVCFVVLTGLVAFFVWRRIRTIRKESAFRQKIAETEMQALRAQMNPHFIFNSLNSIENFIMRNERRLASDYLNKFARLIRMILNSSRNELVPFAKDMEAIQLYVDLEQLRFQCKFTYLTRVDPVLLDGDYRVLSLLIQPYVENAIVHGIAHSERKDLQLKVSAYLDKEYIHYVIEDNGVGRQQAEEYNRVNKPHHKSVGLQISEDRMHIFNQQKEAHGEIRVTDLHDAQGRASGTRIDISIKAI